MIAEYFGILATQSKWNIKFRNDTPLDTFNRLYVAIAKIIKANEVWVPSSNPSILKQEKARFVEDARHQLLLNPS